MQTIASVVQRRLSEVSARVGMGREEMFTGLLTCRNGREGLKWRLPPK
jgi:hypothetical protein